MMIVAVSSRTKFASQLSPLRVDVILDAGHGGLDGGAVSSDGICEAPITLAIAQQTQLVMRLFGLHPLMTRNDEKSLNFDANASIRENKRKDLESRLQVMREYSNVPFFSIHLNQYPDSKYHGAQVFFSENSREGPVLARVLQERLRMTLDPSNARVCKPAPEGVFLMKNAPSPAVTIECGFLSNPEELRLLQQQAYQTKIAISILCGYFDFVRG